MKMNCKYLTIDRLPEGCPDDWAGMTVFYEKTWLEIVAGMGLGEVGAWQIALDAESILIMPCLTRRTILGKMAFLPPLTPYWGLAWKSDLPDERMRLALKVLTKLCTGRRIALPPEINLPSLPFPYRIKSHSTRIIKPAPEEKLWQNLSPSCRQKIRSAQNEVLAITVGTPQELSSLMFETFRRRQVRFPLSEPKLFKTINAIVEKGLGYIRKISQKDGKILSIRLVLRDALRRMSYDIAAASAADIRGGAGNLLLWEEILAQTNQGYTIDLVGTAVSGVAEFKRSFGGEEQTNLIMELFPNRCGEFRYRMARRLGML